MRAAPARRDFDGWVAQLGIDSCRPRARAYLIRTGRDAVPAIRRGLRHPKPMVRRMCVSLLDHLVTEDAVPDLVTALDDPDVGVVKRALHALACDRCKDNECRPSDEAFLDRALDLMEHHPDPDVRASAIDTVRQVAKRRADVAAVFDEVIERERHPALRDAGRRRRPRRQLSQEAEVGVRG